jgi:hypothetical protein
MDAGRRIFLKGSQAGAQAGEGNLSGPKGCGMWGKMRSMTKPPRIYTMSFANIYPLYLTKAEKKGRTKTEVDEIIRWLTGYSQKELEAQLEKGADFETFLAEAPQLNPSRALIKGIVCGVRVEDIEEPTMQGIRYLDKLIDELAKGKAMEKILRKESIFR